MTDGWLDAKLKDAEPPDSELQAVREALDKVEGALEQEGGALRIAERYPCGSYAKSTMLAGRREADLVVVLREAPTDATLEELKTVLVGSTSPEWSDIRYKAVSLGFQGGVAIDVLPVAKAGITEPSSAVPPKLRHALSGPKHVEWFVREAHNTPIHPTVRLLKLFRSHHAAWQALSSFSIEVLAVDLLRGHEGGLRSHFKEVLARIAGGYFTGKVLPDPADAENDLLRSVTEDERAGIAAATRDALRAIESETWSAVFQGASSVLPTSNLGGARLLDPRRPVPWWERWSRWWHDQTLYLHDPRLHGSVRLWPDGHVATWEGTLYAAGHLWHTVIQWRPGTPFIPPRFYPVGCFSRAHQLLDLSMCLAPPSSLRDGWSGVPDLGFWIEQAIRWFEGYPEWEVPQHEWMMLASFLPAPEYRSAVPATMFVAVPPAWDHARLASFGTFRVRLPKERRGMGAVTSWRAGQDATQRWDVATALVEGAHDDVQGVWIAMRAVVGEGVAPPPRDVQRQIRRTSEKALARGKPLVQAVFDDLSSEPGDRVWIFSQDMLSALHAVMDVDEPGLPAYERLQQQQARMARFLPWPGVRLDRRRLEARRVAGKARDMIERISSAHVMLVGLGALGSEVAHLLVREGVARFTLIDGDMLLPENVARHRADLADAGHPKVEAMRRDILRANPSAKVDAVVSWLDHLVPAAGWSDARPTLAVGLTGHEGSEHVLGDRCTELGLPCLHAWLEMDGRALRLFRALPDRGDPTLLELSRSPETSIPPLPRRPTQEAHACADNVLPGSAANVHAAANFVARVALDVITGRGSSENHWIFAPDGLTETDPTLPPALRMRYGVASFTLARPAA